LPSPVQRTAGRWVGDHLFPGRCPGLSLSCPSGANKEIAGFHNIVPLWFLFCHEKIINNQRGIDSTRHHDNHDNHDNSFFLPLSWP
jgi:hypothetical protein